MRPTFTPLDKAHPTVCAATPDRDLLPLVDRAGRFTIVYERLHRREQQWACGGPGRSETVYDGGGHEFPHVDPRRRNTAHRFGYFATTKPGEAVLPSGVARIDMTTGEREAFDFGSGEYCIEPIFDAEHVSGGPIAKAHLGHHTPFSFHGFWSPAA